MNKSILSKKYNEIIDRESAYELLNKKIALAEKEAEEIQKKEASTSRRTTSSSKRKSTRINPVVKVLTSATFIRGVMGVLNKMMR